MSRIGRLPIQVPKNVEVKFEPGKVWVKGPKGEMTSVISKEIEIHREDDKIILNRPSNSIRFRSLHGLTRTLIHNMILGVTNGFKKSLEINGVGYKAEKKGTGVQLSLGFSHSIYFVPPKGITLTVPVPTKIEVSGVDKSLVGQVAAKIRSYRPPEPYKGKGIRYEGEFVRRKAGKTAG